MNKKNNTSPVHARRPRKGFTLIELMISITLLGLIITISSSIYANFFGSMRNLKAANTVYNETRFLMEKIVKEVRDGTIDYEEYYNQNQRKKLLGSSYDAARNETYAQDYCKYGLEFYDAGDDGEIGTYDDVPRGTLAEGELSAIGDSSGQPEPIRNELFLINSNGDRRTYIKRMEETVNGRTTGKIGILKLAGKDFGIDHIDSTDTNNVGTCKPDVGEGDGRIDTWICEDGFNCESATVTITNADGSTCTGVAGETIITDPAEPADNSFVNITPAALDVVNIKFIISPMDDPYKAFDNKNVQIQPSATIKIIARANPVIAAQFRANNVPDIVLESTVSARAMNEIVTECNLKQCIPDLSEPKPCPLYSGVCGPNPEGSPPANPDADPAMQECSADYLWSGCGTQDYIDYAEVEYPGITVEAGDNNLYQSGSEFSSCDTDNACKTLFCTDGYDNDCDSFIDEADPDCVFHLCNNGLWDEGAQGDKLEQCRDVGGICRQIRPVETTEVSCDDGYDNDCDGYADEFDPDCVIAFCKDKLQTPPVTDPPTERFLGLTTAQKDYLYGAASYDTGLNETCIDVGGICDLCYTTDRKTDCVCGSVGCTNDKIVTSSVWASGGETGDMCNDGLDNDCDGYADELDNGCLEFYCTNSVRNCNLAPPGYTPSDYLGDYHDKFCQQYPFNFNDEVCADVGGLCEGFREVNETTERYVDHAYSSAGENVPVAHSAPPETDTCKTGNCPQTSAVDTCTDGLDNNCDGETDWQDAGCCQDNDGDGYPGVSDICKHAKDGGVVPDSVLLDCNDSDQNIRPRAAEVCDNARYPADYHIETLRNQPIDNNCSFLNSLSPGPLDSSDSACCVDTDTDGYGVPSAYLSCVIPDTPDCNDADSNVHPGQTESGAVMCFNQKDGYPINDNCNSTDNRPQANNIDWYSGKTKSWFTNYGVKAGFDTSGLTTGGIAAAYKLGLFEPTCCSLTATEICNDSGNSDENCDGLEGEDDHVCVNENRLRFLDNFTSGSYIALAESGAYRDPVSGNITLGLPTDVGTVTSSAITPLNAGACGGYRVFLSPTASLPPGTKIEFQISGDDGATWCGKSSCDGASWFTIGDLTGAPPAYAEFSDPDYNIKWRARLSGDSGSNIPVLDKLSVSIQCS
jgi:prepilin-type N-terminal cleavage/methylation domain-containing protein